MNMKGEKGKNMRNRGITLIALVITIIVLLILAGVSIATLTGQNGILTRAQDSKTQTGIAEEKEAINLAYSGAVAEKRGTGDITADDLNREFGTNGTNATAVDNGDGTITVTFDPPSNRVYTIDADGNISDPTTGEVPPSEEPGNPDDNGIFQDTSTIDGGEATANNPTIPAGFRPMDTETSSWGDGTSAPSAENIANGLVITDAQEGEVGNEFVWIPATVDEIATATGGTDSNGNPNYQGKLYTFTSTEANVTTSFREPDTVSYDGDTANNYLDIINGILGTTYSSSDTSTFLEDMQKDYNKMVKSVGEYGGFYVSRYEMSKSTITNQAASVANVTPLVNDSNNRWYGLYAYGKTYNTSSVESSMIWGSQYDAMMRWMQGNDVDVTGNIGNNRNTGTTTGTSGTDIINNIYDLYGCHYEWTLEALDTSIRVGRGR